MKFTTERKPLLDALTLAARLAARRSTIPILAHVKLATARGRVVVTGTNMDRVASAEVPAAIGATGETTVNAERLLAFVRNAADGSQVEIEQTPQGMLALHAGRAKALLPTLPIDGFPDISEGEFASSFEIPARQLTAAIAFVQHAVANDETRIFLNGIYLWAEDGRLVFVGCDGFSMAEIKITLPAKVEAFDPPTIPRECLEDLKALAGATDETVLFEISDNRLQFTVPGRRLSTKLLDTTYPDYRRIIPADSPQRFSAGRVALEAAVARCSGMADGKDRTLKVEAGPGLVTVSARATDIGEIQDDLDADTAKATGAFFVHAVRIGNALEALACPDVEVAFGNEWPIVLRDPTDPDKLQVVGAQKG